MADDGPVAKKLAQLTKIIAMLHNQHQDLQATTAAERAELVATTEAAIAVRPGPFAFK